MKKLLIVVDYQNDFVHGSLGFPKAAGLETAIADKISAYRKSGGDVAFTYDTHGQDYMDTQEGKNLPVPHCIRDTEGWALYGKVAGLVKESDKCFFKPSFGSAELFDYLRASDYDTIELAGVVSNICVISNAVLSKTALPEAKVIVDPACVASNDDDLNAAALKVMSGLQIQIL